MAEVKGDTLRQKSPQYDGPRQAATIWGALRQGATMQLVGEQVMGAEELARALHVSSRSVQRWHSAGWITPVMTTPGGWNLWDVEQVREQLAARRQTDDGPPPSGGG